MRNVTAKLLSHASLAHRRFRARRALYRPQRQDHGLYVVNAVTASDQIVDDGRCVANKPRGLQAARKLRNGRRENRWVRRLRLCAQENVWLIKLGKIGGQVVQEACARQLLQDFAHRWFLPR